MTTYRAIASTETDPEAPITSTLMKALQQNLLAVQEGDATAPSILDGLAAKSTAGGVGTYAWARCTTGDVAFGSTTAGSNLLPTSAAYGVSGTFANPFVLNTGAALSGTWRCMGTFDSTTTSNLALLGSTLWLRIS